MAQMKKTAKTPEKELDKMETRNLLGAEFKTLVIKMFRELSEDLSGIKEKNSSQKERISYLKCKKKIYRESTE